MCKRKAGVVSHSGKNMAFYHLSIRSNSSM